MAHRIVLLRTITWYRYHEVRTLGSNLSLTLSLPLLCEWRGYGGRNDEPDSAAHRRALLVHMIGGISAL
jgi:hypothetical protein